MKKLKYIMVSLFAVLMSCDGDDIDIPASVLPSNLTVSAQNMGGGVVNFTASATNANYYHFDFGDGSSALDTSGEASKTYDMIGDNTYTVTVTAGSTEGKKISETIDVSVSIAFSDPETVAFLTNDSSKTWFLAAAQPGHLGLGPAREGIDGDWWYPKWYSASAFEKCGSDDSDCLCDDELTFSVDATGVLSYTLDNKGQTYFNVGHKAVVGGAADMDFCYDFDTTGSKSVVLSEVTGNVPEDQTTGIQMSFSDGGFMGYYVGSSTYEILSISDTELYVRTYDTENADLAWYHKFNATAAVEGGDESLETIYTNLVWSDEFDVDGAPNPANWGYDLGAGGWGNGEAQEYTDAADNVIVEDGVLKITARGSGAVGGAVHYYDDITLIATGGETLSVQDFESNVPVFTDFGGASTAVIDNPDASGVNTSDTVAESTKNSGAEVWAGSFFDITAPLDLATYSSMNINTWSPATGAVVRLKIENQANSDEFFEVDATTSVAESWETLSFDLSGAPAFNYDRVVLFFDFGVSPTGGAAYTSARIKSENLFEFAYGRVEIRAKLPSAGGTWPALWALGANFDEVGWPATGEIDIMEHVGNNNNTVSSALHYPGNSGGNAVVGTTPVETATSEFHNYTVEWTPESIKFVVDDQLIHNSFVNNATTPFNSDFFLIMNVAMGGTLGGAIDPAFTEDTMEVDYVRVYQ
ncbi:glycoside hydrolase family 16 protein [Maribacter sp. BPC-D8]|uniref:glycoside hydrolase family 16 protein n=1 Tax=Maribacter sp. BPC-D8 TaxID=3053613 RepID=UPI002B49CAEC|nr:glycoside hydrolase family 16 protein [Maribacter sp. BPC-D8]WRI28222.1 glycoside hydrolase family 16 protein [Maribacter sp. BPC-D8]